MLGARKTKRLTFRVSVSATTRLPAKLRCIWTAATTSGCAIASAMILFAGLAETDTGGAPSAGELGAGDTRRSIGELRAEESETRAGEAGAWGSIIDTSLASNAAMPPGMGEASFSSQK